MIICPQIRVQIRAWKMPNFNETHSVLGLNRQKLHPSPPQQESKVWIQPADAIKNLHAILREMGRNTFYLTLQNEQQIELCRGQVAEK